MKAKNEACFEKQAPFAEQKVFAPVVQAPALFKELKNTYHKKEKGYEGFY